MPVTKPLSTFLLLAALYVLATGCGYGLVGKKTTKAVNQLDDNVVASLGQIRGDAMDYLKKTRDSLFAFLHDGTQKEAHDISLGVLEGTIGYLDSAENREALARFVETMINRTGDAARGQLIAFRDQLLDERATAKLQTLLRGVMQELVLRPTDNLLNLVLSGPRQAQLNSLLTMVVPAVLNDSAIHQIGKLRSTLLGYEMKKDIAGLVDTALFVANHRLDSSLRPTIKSIVDENTGTIKKHAVAIIIGLAILAIIVGLVIYEVQHRQVKLNKRLLHNVAYEIQNMAKWSPDSYKQLTGKIKTTMQEDDLEDRMNTFLKEKRLS